MSNITKSVIVDAQALATILQALINDPHQIRELQALRGLPDNPIDLLVNEYNAGIQALAPARLDAACSVCIGFSGDQGTHNDYLDRQAAVEVLMAALNV